MLINTKKIRVWVAGMRDIWAVFEFGRKNFPISSNDMKAFLKKQLPFQSKKMKTFQMDNTKPCHGI